MAYDVWRFSEIIAADFEYVDWADECCMRCRYPYNPDVTSIGDNELAVAPVAFNGEDPAAMCLVPLCMLCWSGLPRIYLDHFEEFEVDDGAAA